MRKYKYHYFQFPLCLLQKVHEDSHKGWEMIISYGLLNFAGKLPDKPPEDIEDWQAEWWDQKDKLDVAAHILSISLGSKKNNHERYNEALTFISGKVSIWGSYPEPGIKTSFIFDARDKKYPNETELMAALIGIKSLIGQWKYTATYKSVVVCRMCGCKRNDELEQTLAENPFIRAVHEKYSTRRRFDGLIKRLLDRGFIRSKIAYGRQIFISDELDFDELADAIAHAKRKTMFKKKEIQARQAIKLKLNENYVHLYNSTAL